MMNTLKEIENKYIYVGSPAIGMKPLFDEIKEEAKKWIDELNSGKLVNIGFDKNFETPINVISREKPQGKIETYHIIAWIKHFFNLKEESK